MNDLIVFLIVIAPLVFVIYRLKKKKKAAVQTSEFSIEKPFAERKYTPAIQDAGIVYPSITKNTLFSVKYIDFKAFPTDFDIESEIESFMLGMQTKAEERDKSMWFQYVPCGPALLIICTSV